MNALPSKYLHLRRTQSSALLPPRLSTATVTKPALPPALTPAAPPPPPLPQGEGFVPLPLLPAPEVAVRPDPPPADVKWYGAPPLCAPPALLPLPLLPLALMNEVASVPVSVPLT